MNTNELNGTWIGQYTFGEGYPQNFYGRSVLFSVHMTVSNGELKGDCFDNDHPFDEPAVIEGNIENELISFVKRYPHAYEVDIDGIVVLKPDEPSHEVYYHGELANGMFHGNWTIMISEEEGMQFSGSGTWTMQRE